MRASAADRVTLREVADRAGVSMATASKALNGRDDVAAQTRSRVLAVAESLAFRPNRIAMSLAGSATASIGLITNELAGRFTLPVLVGIEDRGGRENLSVLLSDGRGDHVREQHNLGVLEDRQVDGIVVIGRKTNPRPSISASVSVPVVYVYTPSEDPADTSFVPDDRAGAVLATKHLVETGRCRIAYVGGSPEWLATWERAVGFESTLREAGLEPAAPIRHGDWSQAWGRTAAARLLADRDDVDAIFCASDVVATGVMDVLRDRGIRCPDDIAIVGFDNWEPFAEGTRPPLTTVDMDLEKLGGAAVDALVSASEGRPAPGLHLRPCRLVTRESSAVAG